MEPVFYVYEAALHCRKHSYARFGAALDCAATTDREGNPIGSSWKASADDYCEDCAYEAIDAAIAAEKDLGLALLSWHSSGGSGIYAVGSTLYAGYRAASIPEAEYNRAIRELRRLRADANYPECVSTDDEAECNHLADRLTELRDEHYPAAE